jgi:hypothetical protein
MPTGDFLRRGETIDIAWYIQMFQKLLSALHDKCLLKAHGILQANAQPHTICLTSGVIEKYG